MENTARAEPPAGPVAGITAATYLAFAGIPYARPPVGALRFRPPEPAEPWNELRDCTVAGPIAPQNVFELEKVLGVVDFPQSEDCLTLNVYTPSVNGNRPVMVWLHGGAFATGTGSTPWYEGGRLCELHDVVVVTINYRVGALGFCYLAELAGKEFESTGMNGILDQVAALQWVRDNIVAFGGDPANVTVFGESAGAMSVATLLGTPSASGLFSRAILQSGGGSHTALPAKATAITLELLEVLGIAPGDAARLADVPVETLIPAQLTVTDRRGAYLTFQPVVDGAYLPRSPMLAVRDGAAAGVDLIVGTNLEEMKLFAITDPALVSIDESGMISMMMALGDVAESQARTLLDAYRAEFPALDLAGVWSQLLTDYAFRMPAIHLAQGQAHHASVYNYLFSWKSTAFGGIIGCSHSLEIPFVFDNLHMDSVDLFTGGDSPGRQELATNMSTAWTAFANGKPPAGPTTPEWPEYDEHNRSTMIFDTQCAVVDDPEGPIRSLWEEMDFAHI